MRGSSKRLLCLRLFVRNERLFGKMARDAARNRTLDSMVTHIMSGNTASSSAAQATNG